MFKAQNSYEACLKWEMTFAEGTPKCIKSETRRIVTSRVHSKDQCIEHGNVGGGEAMCTQVKTGERLYPTTVTADVYYITPGKGDNEEKFLFSKAFDIPKCK